jgi:uncharacterized membrane protein YfcA
MLVIFYRYRTVLSIALLCFGLLLALIFYLNYEMLANADWKKVIAYIQTEKFWKYAAVGFIAQLIDGALGMAYGVSATTFLLSAGVSPVSASAAVHLAEVFTTGASGISHIRFGNVNKKLFYALMLPGALGAAFGAYVLTNIDGDTIKPIISVYLLFMGIVIVRKAFYNAGKKRIKSSRIPILAAFGGFVDAVGGGGWGPVVNSNLIGGGRTPRYSIGTVSMAEFFVTFASTSVFSFSIGLSYWQVILGLIIGGVAAAPFAAFVASKIKPKALMISVGVLVIALSLRTILKYLQVW